MKRKDWCIKMVKFVNPQNEEKLLKENDPIIVLDTSCQIQSFNDFAAQLFNISDSESNVLYLDELSKSRWNNFVKKLRKQTVGYCNLNIRIGESSYKEVKLIGHLNEKENLITAKILVRAPENVKSGLNNDIFISMFNEISNGVIISYVDGIVIDINDVALQYLECKRADVIHVPIDNILGAFSNFSFQKFQFYKTLRNNGGATIELSKENEHGEENYYKIDSKFNVVTKKVVTTITDITETIRLKQQVERQKHLSSVGEMAASIVHEIRNPMTSLRGFLDLMKMNCKDENKRYLHIMDSELERMETMLSELLYLSKPTERKMDRVLIYQALNEVVELMQQSAIMNNIVIQLNVVQSELRVTSILGNETRLKQLLINLIKNAIEVMDCGGIITIELDQTNENHVQISVIDEGAGMTDEERNQLFTPFYTTKESGTGLGLALVKKVVDEHQGTINVESTVGVGTTFIMEIPLYTCENASEHNNQYKETWINSNSIKLPVL